MKLKDRERQRDRQRDSETERQRDIENTDFITEIEVGAKMPFNAIKFALMKIEMFSRSTIFFISFNAEVLQIHYCNLYTVLLTLLQV